MPPPHPALGGEVAEASWPMVRPLGGEQQGFRRAEVPRGFTNLLAPDSQKESRGLSPRTACLSSKVPVLGRASAFQGGRCQPPERLKEASSQHPWARGHPGPHRLQPAPQASLDSGPPAPRWGLGAPPGQERSRCCPWLPALIAPLLHTRLCPGKPPRGGGRTGRLRPPPGCLDRP